MFHFKKMPAVLMIAAAVIASSAVFADSAAPGAKPQCDACKPVAVTKPVTNGKGLVIGHKTVTEMNCPGCMDAIQSLLNRGKFEHTCSMCGEQAKETCANH
jgi:hypothetical protein